mgnify:CR=1 FL=1
MTGSPEDSIATLEGILLALEQPQLRRSAAQINLELIRERAEIGMVRKKVAEFFHQFAGK